MPATKKESNKYFCFLIFYCLFLRLDNILITGIVIHPIVRLNTIPVDTKIKLILISPLFFNIITFLYNKYYIFYILIYFIVLLYIYL